MDSDLRTYLEKRLMYFYPDRYIREYVQSTSDIYENRAILKEIIFDDRSIKYIVDLIVNDVKSNRRFRRNDCLKILKRILKHRKSIGRLDSSIVKALFYLYKEFVFSNSEDIRWCVSTFIKDQVLEDDDLNWLISHYESSDHIVNRLLRYPQDNNLLTNWARKVYLNSELKERFSEVVAILVDDDFPKFVDTSNTGAIMWAIYYAKCSDEAKQRLIKKHINSKALDSSLEVAMRLGYPSIIEYILKEYT